MEVQMHSVVEKNSLLSVYIRWKRTWT